MPGRDLNPHGPRVTCAQAIIDASPQLDLEARAGVHTGEVETLDGKVAGIADDRGDAELKGIPGHWQLYAVAA
jgi:hypothetical protein